MKKLIWIFIFLIITIELSVFSCVGYKYVKSRIKIKILDKVTVYNPTKAQCDSDPLITASLDTINMKNFPDNWLALSRDLLAEGFQYHDVIYVCFPEGILKMVLKDTMNKRYKNRGDILSKKTLGMWYNIKIIKF